MNTVALILALLASPTPAVSGAPPTTLFGIAIGRPATAMVGTLGDPFQRRPEDGRTDFVYADPSYTALLFVHVTGGNVTGIGVQAAPWGNRFAQPGQAAPGALGIALGDTLASVAPPPNAHLISTTRQGADASSTYRGSDGLIYTFVADSGSGKIDYILVEMPAAAASALVLAADPPVHTGASPADAIVDLAPNEDVGVRAEYLYLDFQSCGKGGSWKAQRQSLMSKGNRSYDLMSEVCSDGGAKRDFYFDITGYFGKM